MNEKPEQFTHQEMQEALALHVWKNDHIREEILKNPKAAIEKELNVKFDDSFKVDVVNHTEPNRVTFILPYNINKAAGQQLSDDQLAEVAGGFSFGDIVKTVVKDNARNVGGFLGDKIGDGVKFGGSKFGVALPDTGLGEKLGRQAGGMLADSL